MKLKFNLFSMLLGVALCISTFAYPVQPQKSGDQNFIDFLNLKFGMFIHYNMGTYHHEQWAYPFHDPRSFTPDSLDCSQWARAAKSAGMRYAVLTAKHHDGFCLWNTSVTSYDIASSGYNKDIVKQFVDAFHAEGIAVGLYFSIWDRHHGIEHGNINKENIAFIKRQLTELLTNYGEIRCLVFDGWGSEWGNGPDFEELPFSVLADHVHSIQPNCLVINHSCKTDLSVTQIVHYEATHGQHCPYDNTIPSQQGPTLQSAWFWEPGFENQKLKSVESIAKELNFTNSHYCNYLLNAAPNNKGLMDKNVIKRLKEIGEVIYLKDEKMTVLPPAQKVQRNVTVTASSEASKEFKASNVIDANLFTRWKFAENDKRKWVELDFGKPEAFNTVVCGELNQDVKAFKIEALINGKWQEIVKADKMTFNFQASFTEITAQKYRLTVLDCETPPLIAEITLIRY